MKMALNDNRLQRFEQLLHSEDEYSRKNVLREGVEGIEEEISGESEYSEFSEEDISVHEAFFEEYRKEDVCSGSFDAGFLEPKKLLEKLQKYSTDQLKHLSTFEAEPLFQELDFYIQNGQTPLLKFYSELKDFFKIPSRSLLSYERMHFYKYLKIFRTAQNRKIREVIESSHSVAERVVEERLEGLEKVLREEAERVVKKVNGLEDEVDRLKELNEGLQTMVKDQEFELTEYKELCRLSVRSFNPPSLSQDRKDTILSLLSQLNQVEKIDKVDQPKSPKGPGEDLTSILCPNEEEEEVLTKPEIFDLIDKNFQRITIEPISKKIRTDSLLDGEFRVFGSSVRLLQSDKASLVSSEVNSYYKSCIKSLTQTLSQKDLELNATMGLNKLYRRDIKGLKATIEDLKEEIEDLNTKFTYRESELITEIQDKERNYQQEKQSYVKFCKEWKDLTCEEIGVKDAIIKELRKRNNAFKSDIKELKEIIAIPRSHFKNLEKLNFQEMVDQKKKIEEGFKTERENSLNSKNSKNGRNYKQKIRSTSTNQTYSQEANLQFPLVGKSHLKVTRRRNLMRNEISPGTQRSRIYDTIRNSGTNTMLQRSTEDGCLFDIATTLDTRRNSPKIHLLENSQKSFSKGSLYSLMKSSKKKKFAKF